MLIISVIYSPFFQHVHSYLLIPKPFDSCGFLFYLSPASPAGFLYHVNFPGFLLLLEKPLPTITLYRVVQGHQGYPCLAYIENADKALCILCVCLFYTKMGAHMETRGKPQALPSTMFFKFESLTEP